MRRFLTRGRVAVAAAALGGAVMLPLIGCSPESILTTFDPDIIDPRDVDSPDAAEALYVGALGRLSGITAGGESFFLIGGLLADEWRSGDTFNSRDETDQRNIQPENDRLIGAARALDRARLATEQAVSALREFAPTPAVRIGEMFFVRSFAENLAGESYCNGLVFSAVGPAGELQYGDRITVDSAFRRAAATTDSGLANISGDVAGRVANALRVTKGRALLNRGQFVAASTAVTAVPTSYAYVVGFSPTTGSNQIWALNNSARRYTMINRDGGNGLDFIAAADPRLPRGPTVVRGSFDSITDLVRQLKWPLQFDAVAIVTGIEARLIQAEAQLQASNPSGFIATLNALRATVTGLAPLTDPGTQAARVDMLFRERAFWMFGTGHRLGDLRRLIRQYGRPANTIFPTGTFFKGGTYGTDVNFPLALAEANNPNVMGKGCIDRAA